MHQNDGINLPPLLVMPLGNHNPKMRRLRRRGTPGPIWRLRAAP